MTLKLYYCIKIISNCGFPVFNKFRTINFHMSNTLGLGSSWLKSSQLNYTNLKLDGRTDGHTVVTMRWFTNVIKPRSSHSQSSNFVYGFMPSEEVKP